MSQHLFEAPYQGRTATVRLGWDRRLGQYFMIIEHARPGEPVADDPEYLYVHADDASTPGLDDFRSTLQALAITVPESMFRAAEQDRLHDAGNRYVWHAADGSHSGA